MTRTFTLCCLGLALAVSPVLGQKDMTVDQIVAKHLEARGGAEAWKSLESARIEANMSMPAMGVEAPFVMEWKRPQKMRVDVTMQGMVITNAYDGTIGWQIMPMMGNTDPQEMPDDELEQLLDQADFEGPLMDYQEKGHSVELVGKEDLEGTEVYKLKLTKKNGDIVYTYLDADAFLEIRQDSRQTIQGTEMETTTILGDYKQVGDLVMPHAMEISFDGGPVMQTLTITAVELDPAIADARFTMPAVAPVQEEEAAE